MLIVKGIITSYFKMNRASNWINGFIGRNNVCGIKRYNIFFGSNRNNEYVEFCNMVGVIAESSPNRTLSDKR